MQQIYCVSDSLPQGIITSSSLNSASSGSSMSKDIVRCVVRSMRVSSECFEPTSHSHSSSKQTCKPHTHARSAAHLC